jgi:hypothetical protein
MAPRLALQYQLHRGPANAIAGGERGQRPTGGVEPPQFAHGSGGEFRPGDPFTARGALGMGARPMPLATRQSFRMFVGVMICAVRLSAVSFSVRSVLRLRAPGKIIGAVIDLVPVKMAAHLAWAGRADKGDEDEDVNAALQPLPPAHEGQCGVPVGVGARDKPTATLTAPVVLAPDVPVAGHEVAGIAGDGCGTIGAHRNLHSACRAGGAHYAARLRVFTSIAQKTPVYHALRCVHRAENPRCYGGDLNYQ